MLAGSSETADILPQLQNIVATVNLGVKLDLKGVALHARNAEYNPKVIGLQCDLLLNAIEWQPVSQPSVLPFPRPMPRLKAMSLCLQRFSAVIMRIRDPKTTALIFASGKVVSPDCPNLMPSLVCV